MTKRKQPKHTPAGHTTIAGHTKQGTKFTPPMLTLPNLQFQSWQNNRLPEMLWATLIVSHFEQPVALRLMADGINFLGGKRLEKERDCGESPVSIDCDVTHTGLSQMDGNLLRGFLSHLTTDEECRAVLRPLLLFDSLPVREVWSEALGMQPEPDDWHHLMQAVAVTLDHQSQEATDCRFARVMAAIAGGHLYPLPQQLEEFWRYPDVDLQKVRPSIRTCEGALGVMFADSTNHEWRAQFWEKCLSDTPCWSLHAETATNKPPQVRTTPAHIQELKKLLIDHCNQKRPSSAVDARYDTVFGIGLYSLNVLEDLLRIGIGNTVLARFGLRSLVDNLITLSYLAHKDDSQLWQSYRVFGSGQAKLQYLKLEADETKPSYVNVETLQNLANEDIWEEFLQIELGHWEKSNTRKMSEEGGVKDFYDRFYGWTSTYSHGHWGAIRDTVFDTCGNPLHRLHRIPRNSPHVLPDVVPDAAACMDKILEAISRCYPDFPHRVTI
jgi:Family of unknown function (DUF5677)